MKEKDLPCLGLVFAACSMLEVAWGNFSNLTLSAFECKPIYSERVETSLNLIRRTVTLWHPRDVKIQGLTE